MLVTSNCNIFHIKIFASGMAIWRGDLDMLLFVILFMWMDILLRLCLKYTDKNSLNIGIMEKWERFHKLRHKGAAATPSLVNSLFELMSYNLVNLRKHLPKTATRNGRILFLKILVLFTISIAVGLGGNQYIEKKDLVNSNNSRAWKCNEKQRIKVLQKDLHHWI